MANTTQQWDAIQLIKPISTSSTQTGTGFDLGNYDITRGVKVYANVGVVTTAGTLDLKIQDGATSTPATDLDTTSFTQVTSTAGEQEFTVYPRNRYIRAVATLSTGTYVFAVTAFAVKRLS